MNKAADKEKPVELVEVTLAKEHTHAGKEYKEGDKIKVRPNQVDWLRKQGVIKG